MLQLKAKNKGVNNMYLIKGDDQSWADISASIKKFWSNTPSDSDVIDTWDRSVDDALKEIQESVAKLPEKDRDVQAKIRWKDWQEKNNKPKIVDQIERYHNSLKLTTISQKDMQEINEWLKAYSAKREATPPDELKKRDEMFRMQIDPKVMSNLEEWYKKNHGK
jgi:hypothetical protein